MLLNKTRFARSIRTTMNIYTRAVPAALKEANSKMVNLVLPAQAACELNAPFSSLEFREHKRGGRLKRCAKHSRPKHQARENSGPSSPTGKGEA
jgi:hypothetical protein